VILRFRQPDSSEIDPRSGAMKAGIVTNRARSGSAGM
jgi:hypothetical protein